ncbi:MAG: hypothetical protein J6K89_02765, partial [Oscillospiraceae bacterium]|nr:hypothetical protein [Oscillospiraceae bacterium]
IVLRKNGRFYDIWFQNVRNTPSFVVKIFTRGLFQQPPRNARPYEWYDKLEFGYTNGKGKAASN